MMPDAPVRPLPPSGAAPSPWHACCEEFLDDLALRRYSPRTLEWYRYVLAPFGRYLASLEPVPEPAAVQESQVRSFLRQVSAAGPARDKPLGARRLNHYRAGLYLFFQWLAEQDRAPHNPVARVRKVREPRKLLQTLSAPQIEALLQQPDRRSLAGARDYCFLLLLLDSGLRLAEALSLRVEAIDWTAGQVLVTGKGNKERQVALSAELLAPLHRYLDQRQAALAGRVPPGSGWLFPNSRGGRLAPRVVQQRLRRYGEQAGLTGLRVSPHTLRHTYAVHFVRNGGDPFTLQRILGHSSLDITRRYCELAEGDVLDRQRALTPLRLLRVCPDEPPGIATLPGGVH